MKELLADHTFDCQVLTSHIKETEYYEQLSAAEQKTISEWLIVNGFLDSLQTVFVEEKDPVSEVLV